MRYILVSKVQTIGIDELLNRKLCTVDLSRKTIEAERHGLGFLKEHLGIETGEHHRAYADALSAAKVLDACMQNLPENIKTTEDLIKFSKYTPQKKRKRKKEGEEEE
jgi:DNA polymerase-3 subunit epsilon